MDFQVSSEVALTFEVLAAGIASVGFLPRVIAFFSNLGLLADIRLATTRHFRITRAAA